MKKKTIVSVILILAMTLGIFTGCGSSETTKTDKGPDTKEAASADSGEEEVTLRIWVPTLDPSPAPLYVALAEGLFDKAFAEDNVKIETLEFANAPAANEAFLAGELDVASQIGDQPILIGIQSGVESVVIGRSMENCSRLYLCKAGHPFP